MQQITLYHNPRCSKSRQALELLISHGCKPLVIEYLKTPLKEEELRSLMHHFTLDEFIRKDEPRFKELGLSLDKKENIIQALLIEPILMQRPIILYQNKAVIGRPPERVLELINKD
jgi:arsenate reductase